MHGSKTTAFYVLLTFVKDDNIVFLIDYATNTIEAQWCISANHFEAMRFKYILHVANGINPQLPFLAQLLCQSTHLGRSRKLVTFYLWSCLLIFAKNLFYFKIPLHFILYLHLQGINILHTGVGFLSERNL